MRSKTEKKRFVRTLMQSVTKSLLRKIDDGSIPEEWDGHELRALFVDTFAQEAKISEVKRYPRRKRARQYAATVYENNLTGL